MSQAQKGKIADIVSSNEDEAIKIDRIAKVRGWFRPEENSTYYPIVQKYLTDEIDLDTATTQLFSKIDERIIAQKLDDAYLVDFWYSIIHSAKRKSFLNTAQDGLRNADFVARVVSLIAAFRDHRIEGHEEYNYLYEQLFDFSMACREAFNDAPEPRASDVEINAWANVNLFFAKVTANKLSDLSLYAIWTMRDALERNHEDDAEGTVAQKYNVFVPAAASWLFGMGRALYIKEKDLTPSDRKFGNPAKGGELWKGKAEFSKKRWAFWKERMAIVSKMEDVSEGTRNIAKNAVQAMERAETFQGDPRDVEGES